MSRPFTWFPLAAEDPLPGDPDAVADAADRYSRVDTAITEANNSGSEVFALTEMTSEAVDTVAERAREVFDSIEDAAGRYKIAAAALADYADALRNAQSAADTALDEAQSAQYRVDAATQDLAALEWAQANADPTEPPDLSRQWRIRDAVMDRDAAQATITRAAEDLALAVQQHNEAAEGAALKIRSSFDDGFTDGWWQNWGKSTLEWTSKIAGWVATTAGVLALVLAWVPGLGAALAAVALIAGVVALVADTILLITGDKTWDEWAISALGVASFGIGRVATTAFRFATAGGGAASRLSMRSVGLAGKSQNGRLDPTLMTNRPALFTQKYGQSKALIKASNEPGALGREVRKAFNPKTIAQELYGDLKNVGQVKEFAKHPISGTREAFSGNAKENLLTFVGLGDDVRDANNIIAAGRDGRAAMVAEGAPARNAGATADALEDLIKNADSMEAVTSTMADANAIKLIGDGALNMQLASDMAVSFREMATGSAPTPADRLAL